MLSRSAKKMIARDENRYVIWGRISRGLLREYELHEDTQKSKALDQYLGSIGKL